MKTALAIAALSSAARAINIKDEKQKEVFSVDADRAANKFVIKSDLCGDLYNYSFVEYDGIYDFTLNEDNSVTITENMWDTN